MANETSRQLLFLWFLNLLFPRECVSCGSALRCGNRDYLCSECHKYLFRTREPICSRCGRMLYGEITPPVVCFSCREDPPFFDRARSAFILEESGRQFVWQFKYHQCPYLSAPAVRWLKEAGDRFYRWLDYDCIVPVPLHPRKKRERGFNQSKLLARGLSRRSGVSLPGKKLLRHRYTRTQTRLKLRERIRNVQGAFRVVDQGWFREKSILLVDDVYTTGATVNECARVLKEDGALRVDVLTLARAR